MSNASPVNEPIAVVDLGQSKFVVVVAEMVSERNYSVRGYGETAAEGMQKGKVVNIREMVAALQRAVTKAEVMSNEKVDQLCVGISGHYVRGSTHQAATYISGETVSRDDIDQVMQTAQAHQLLHGDRIVHVMEQSYSINRQNGIRQPLGMEGVLLEGSAHVISVDPNVIANIERCLSQAEHPASKIVSNHLASTGSVLTAAEKDLGTVLVDFGAGICDIAIFGGGVIRHIDTVDLAGDEIDEDIARMYRISKGEAEQKKREQGSATEAGEKAGAHPGDANGQLSMIIQAQAEVIFKEIKGRIDPFDPKQFPGGIVLTGGGALLADIDTLASEIIGMPVRIGAPTYAGPHADHLSRPQYAAALGLVEMSRSVRFPHAAERKGLGSRVRSAFGHFFSVS